MWIGVGWTHSEVWYAWTRTWAKRIPVHCLLGPDHSYVACNNVAHICHCAKSYCVHNAPRPTAIQRSALMYAYSTSVMWRITQKTHCYAALATMLHYTYCVPSVCLSAPRRSPHSKRSDSSGETDVDRKVLPVTSNRQSRYGFSRSDVKVRDKQWMLTSERKVHTNFHDLVTFSSSCCPLSPRKVNIGWTDFAEESLLDVLQPSGMHCTSLSQINCRTYKYIGLRRPLFTILFAIFGNISTKLSANLCIFCLTVV